MPLTFSVDGTEEVHDEVRKVKGSFQRITHNIALLNDLEKKNGNKISKSICFTISGYNYQPLGKMADVARSLSIPSVNILPYYHYSDDVGAKYAMEMEEHFDSAAFSWKGFHHEKSGIESGRFREDLKEYRASLGDINDFLPLSEEEYRVWFHGPTTPVMSSACMIVGKLIDIQPNGEANSCVDFPDCSIGNCKGL